MSATAAIWHDVECGSFGADLGLWEELAERAGGPVLDLGCGTGRVALHLARRGHSVTGVELVPLLAEELGARAAGLPLEVVTADAGEIRLEEAFSLALAPMQFMQLLPDRAARSRCLERAAAALVPGGLFAAAIVETMPEAAVDVPPLLPDVREVDGWVYSSLPVHAAADGERIVLQRLRQTVSPAGELREEEDEVSLCALGADQLEEEGRRAGLEPRGRRAVPATEEHVGSAVVLMERLP
ncbi:MAG TPA: class I SAM-dependent methyltransferase [Solirubrobacterales bacterium]|jgi:SAM-dependent methyltransferase|nr:class I SAM-dependent methyltransferase [Solirubrobacterales bacterium]